MEWEATAFAESKMGAEMNAGQDDFGGL